MQALILDLGKTRAAASIPQHGSRNSSLSRATIVTIAGRRGIIEERIAREPAQRFAQPMAVLIDRSSASAAEILAGTLRDHGRAVLVGEPSFGKGTVQSVFGFRDGYGLKLTSARYLLPAGQAIHGTGVAPDVEVLLSADGALRAACRPITCAAWIRLHLPSVWFCIACRPATQSGARALVGGLAVNGSGWGLRGRAVSLCCPLRCVARPAS